MILRPFVPRPYETKGGQVWATPLDRYPSITRLLAIAVHLFEKQVTKDEPCTTCSRPNNKGPAEECILIEHAMLSTGACTNCYTKGFSSRCSYHVGTHVYGLSYSSTWPLLTLIIEQDELDKESKLKLLKEDRKLIQGPGGADSLPSKDLQTIIAKLEMTLKKMSPKKEDPKPRKRAKKS